MQLFARTHSPQDPDEAEYIIRTGVKVVASLEAGQPLPGGSYPTFTALEQLPGSAPSTLTFMMGGAPVQVTSNSDPVVIHEQWAARQGDGGNTANSVLL